MSMLAGLSTGVVVALVAAHLLGLEVTFPGSTRPRTATRTMWLAQADAPVTPVQFGVVSVALAVVVFAVVTAVTSVPSVALVPAVAAGLSPRAWFARNRIRRRKGLRASWPDGLRDVQAAIGAGLSLHQALLDLAARGPNELRQAFERYPARARTVGVVPALRAIQEELADPTSDGILEVLVLAQERGGTALPQVLADLAEATSRDVQASEALLTESLEQRINARAVFVLPWLVLLALTVQDGVFRDFYRTGAGTTVIVVGAAMSLLGMGVVGRLAQDPVEPRVFGAGAVDRPSGAPAQIAEPAHIAEDGRA